MNYPYLELNELVAKKNIKRMIANADRFGAQFRPHFKTHQSHSIGSWFRDAGITSITVSSIYMAEYFAKDGWLDITIAFPANILEAQRLNKLAGLIQIRTLVDDKNIVHQLDDKISKPVSVYIEIDPNYGRSGVPIGDLSTISQLKSAIDRCKNLNFIGFYCHAGNSYVCQSVVEIEALMLPIINQLGDLKSQFGGILCFGDTPSCSVLDTLGDVDEISPGNFIFYDWMQTQIGSCSPLEIAVRLMCPVVAKYPARNELLIHGGAIHFSKEMWQIMGKEACFGVIDTEGLESAAYVKSISQEHGIVRCSNEFFATVNVGDLLPIFPIHSCLMAHQMGKYYTTFGVGCDHFSSDLIGD